MALFPITPPAGIVKNGTDYSNKGRWVDGDLVRFENGYLKPIGGWQKLRDTALDGAVIGLYGYKDNAANNVLAVGTREKVYVLYDGTWTDITPAGFVNDASDDPLGFGAYTYGSEDYGDARSQSGLVLQAGYFSFDNWGEDLIFTFSKDGKIYKWSPDSAGGTPDTIGTAVTNAPTGNLSALVTNERHLVAIGSSDDPRKVAWSTREDRENWTSKASNTAGDLIIPTGGRALFGTKFRSDVIIFSDTGINRMFYAGSPFVYGIADAGSNCKAISPKSVVSTGNFLAWMGENAFYVYDGTVRELPCDVHDFVFDTINEPGRAAAWGGHNSNFNEIWWGFPTGESQYSSNRYVIWNYNANVWSIGTMDRGAWIDQGAFSYPIAGDSDGFVYEHESTTLSNSPNLNTQVPYCQSGPIEIGSGDRLVQVNQIIPDEEANTLPGVTISFKGKYTPLGAETDYGSFTFESDGYTDARFSARQIQMKVTGSTSQDFQVGNIRIDTKARGKR
jgi:hypothetical protein